MSNESQHDVTQRDVLEPAVAAKVEDFLLNDWKSVDLTKWINRVGLDAVREVSGRVLRLFVALRVGRVLGQDLGSED